MKKVAFILPLTILILTGFTANNSFAGKISNAISLSNFEPGETIFIEIPGFDVDQISTIRTMLTSADVGAEWIGYCESWRVVCVKIPAAGQMTLEGALKQVTGGYTLKSTSSVSYTITDSCFVVG